jgi:transcriptional regulator with XRE-family HTH domain
MQHNMGPRIRHLREKKEWTQEELGNRAGFSQSYIAKIETGRAVPSLKRLEKLAQALGVGITDLLEGRDTE